MIIPMIQHEKNIGDLYTVLFNERIIFINEDITCETASVIVAQLMYLDSINQEDITIQISSHGGDMDVCNMIMDAMNIIKSDVRTINMGAAYSCAALLLISGTKGKRYAFPNSKVLLHQPLVGLSGYIQASDLEIRAKESIQRKEWVKELIYIKSNMPQEQIEKAIDRDTFFTAKESLLAGIVDHIL